MDDKKCVVRISSFKTAYHAGKWDCILVDKENDVNVTTNLKLSMTTLIGAEAEADKTSITLKSSESVDVSCKTKSQVYVPTAVTNPRIK